MSNLLIGLAGAARCGKDTAAHHLSNTYNLISYAFADPMREGLMSIFNLSPCDFEGDRKEQQIDWLGKSPRELLQTLGTEWGRTHVHSKVWLLVAQQNLAFLAETHDTASGFVITDLRTENEAEFIRKRGGTVIHLFREDAPTVSAHSTEIRVDIQGNDLVLHNDGSIKSLHEQLDDYAHTLFARVHSAVA